MTLKKFFSSDNLGKFTRNLHTKAQAFFEVENTTRASDFATIPPKQLALFLQQAMRTQKRTTLIIAQKDGSTETLSGQLHPLKNRFDVVSLKISAKQTRLIFVKDIVHLGLNRFTTTDLAY